MPVDPPASRVDRVVGLGLVASLLLLGGAEAQLLPGLAPEVPESAPVDVLPPHYRTSPLDPEAGEVLIAELRAIHLLDFSGSAEIPIADGVFRAEDLIVPSPRTLAKRLGEWLGKPLTDQGLGALADRILDHYDVEGYPVVLIDAPEQDLSAGELQILVEVGTISQVGVSRPKWGNPDAVRRGLLLRRGDILRRADLERQVDWYGRTPFRRPRLFVSPGAAPASADLLIAFEERRPWRIYTGFENSGTDLLGRSRFVVGAVGMTPSEHLLAWQSAFGSPVSSLHAHALRWEIPFHRLNHLLRVEAAYAEVAARYLVGGLPVESDGTSWALATFYQVPLPGFDGWRHHLAAGTEAKGSDQFLLFGTGPRSPGDVLFLHGKVEYQLARYWDDAGISINGSLIAAPGGLGGNNSDDAFRAYDPAAESSYLAGRLATEAWWSPGGDWQLRLRANSQLADSRLLPAEQFAAGGYASVRGVGEREVLGDSGWHTSFELISPPIRPLRSLDLRFLAFIDHAGVSYHGGPGQSLSGTGVGLRLRLASYLNLRFDHGWRLDDRGDRSHLGLMVSF